MDDSMMETYKETAHRWTDDETRTFIHLRALNDHLFTGKRNAAKHGWETVLIQLGLQDKVSITQAGKKWENMKKKYKEMKNLATVSGTESLETTAAMWRWYFEMDDAFGSKDSISPSVLYASSSMDQPSASPLSPASMSSACLNSSGTPERCTSTEILDLLKEHVTKEEHCSHAENGSEAVVTPQDFAHCSQLELKNIEESIAGTVKEAAHKWTDGETRIFIHLRVQNDHLFTGKKNAAKHGWETILKELGLLDKVSFAQAAKKWENLKKRYKELSNTTIGFESESKQNTAATWRWYFDMDEAFGNKTLISPPVLIASSTMEQPTPPSPGSAASSSSACHSSSPELPRRTPKKRRRSSNEILDFLKEQAEKEDKREAEAQKRVDRFLELFTKLIDKM
ncbi:uncharacterized protein LOC131696491 isoform X1 [Acipenser ruthenus]|uniref:uncharacterized protein LOC131696491 isoform X1 n=1 Tax=Acipenser ruthenus TaxID=7906 RepID=UPI00145A384C|nr:uncharacterized protein LOC131696491 isoform X1 [Acipenser ruthenus]